MTSAIDPFASGGAGPLSAADDSRRDETVATDNAAPPAGGQKPDSAAATEGRSWRALCLVEIENFAVLRRHVGRRRADVLAGDIAGTMAAVAPAMRCRIVGRSTLELSFAAHSSAAARAEIERMHGVFAEPVAIDSEYHLLSLRLGAALAPASDDDEVRLAEVAESALERARAEDRVVVFDLTDQVFAFNRPALVRDLPRAIEAGEMVLRYQPKVHIRRQEVAGVEALIRWRHPEYGLIPPGEFIGAAEAAGQIRALTLWTLNQVLADQRAMAKAGHDVPAFINISGVLLADIGFVDEACAIIRGDGARIGFEITETSVIRDPEVALKHLQCFVDIGVTVAIDDYGAGLSSLAYLKQLPASELKIDKMFVTQLTSSNRDPLIVRSTIDLAHAMEMEVTAEGVETPAALALLSVMGCDLAQGFLISRPVDLPALLAFLQQDGHLATTMPTAPAFDRGEDFWKSG